MSKRVIDVVFVHPKNRHLVVWHDGEWWQINKMSLNETTWGYKTPYTGTTDEIFIAKSQALTCHDLAKTLKTHELPDELRGISATRFLTWWSVNDYDWLNRDIVALPLPNDEMATTQNHTPQASTQPTANQSTPKQPAAQKPVPQTQAAATPTPKPQAQATATPPTQAPTASVAKSAAAMPHTNTQQAAAQQAAPSTTQPVAQAAPPQKPTQPPQPPATQAVPTAATAPKASDENKDIFDSLLDDLQDEILHHK